MQLTKQQQEQIKELQDKSNLDMDLLYIIESADAENMDELREEIDEQTNGYNVEIIYYANAMDYLRQNDPSLKYSLELAQDLGYQAKDLHSELLASILASENERENFGEIEDQLEEILFPDDLERTDEETEEDNQH